MPFIRRKGKAYYLVHNVRRRGRVRQLHLARLGARPRITDEVVRRVSRRHPLLEVNWRRLRERVNGRVELFDLRSEHLHNLIQSLRALNLDLADISPALFDLTGSPEASREFVTQLRLLRATVDVKLEQLEQNTLARAGGPGGGRTSSGEWRSMAAGGSWKPGHTPRGLTPSGAEWPRRYR